ncbi:MAG: hypothetical protein JWQ09_2977 [Segetibacter sp.]|nr:hypothetical protein [Segetibacter sp.]
MLIQLFLLLVVACLLICGIKSFVDWHLDKEFKEEIEHLN